MTQHEALFHELLSTHLSNHDDQTIYLPADTFRCTIQQPSSTIPSTEAIPADHTLTDYLWGAYPQENEPEPRSIDFSIAAKPPIFEKQSEVRGQASRCYQGSCWSFTVRGAEGLRKLPAGEGNPTATATATAKEDTSQPVTSVKAWMSKFVSSRTGYAPAKDHVHSNVDEVALVSYGEVGGAILDLLQAKPGAPLKGLLFITGETKCGKSYIARGIIHDYLRDRKYLPQDRNPHLVTFEDPIEKWFYAVDDLTTPAFSPTQRRVDYTPRQKGVDCKSLKDCTRDALRQTPTVLFAGEIRDPKELAEVVNFGGTGHLVIATGHAGSLIEATDKIFAAMKIKNSVQRAASVPKLLGIVHLKKIDVRFVVESRVIESSAVVPALYRRCSAGIQALVSDGLASLLPYCPAAIDDVEQYGCLGRQYMARKVLLDNDIRAPVINPRWSDSWNLRCDDSSKLQSRWTKHWPSIRSFHGGFGTSGPAINEDGHHPLWVQCAEDDLSAI